MFVGVTDKNWYKQLSASGADEVNFWTPGGQPFTALKEGGMFLFKLHYPENCIVGGGFFVRFSIIPPFLAWQAFGEKNGTKTYAELLSRINKYRPNSSRESNPNIGCIILSEPFWFDEKDWFTPLEWSKNIVKGKAYDSETEVGKRMFEMVMQRISHSNFESSVDAPRYTESLTKHRIGQGGFRVIVTEAYQRKCAITGEKTLPVLEAAHIKPYSQEGPHAANNGILLKSDFHTLYDDGYITITPDYHIEVSKRLHEDYGNGKDYYKYHGEKLLILPDDISQRPSEEYLDWHNNNVFLG